MKFYIYDNKTKKNGEAVVYLIVPLNNKVISFNTGVSVLPVNFDRKKGRIKGKSKKVKDDNLILQSCENRVGEIFVRYRLQHRELTPELLKQEYTNPSLYVDFYGFMAGELKTRLKDKDITPGTYKLQMSVLEKLKNYKKSLSFTEITPEFINKYRVYLRVSLNNKVNTIHKDLKTIKSYLNIAQRRGIIEKNPFDSVIFKQMKTSPTHCTVDELSRLWALYDDPGTKLNEREHDTLRCFLFMSECGCRVGDFLKFTENNIVDNKLCYRAEKVRGTSNIEIKVLLSPRAKRLLKEAKGKNGRLFNYIPEQNMNSLLKGIAASAGINKTLTNHSARHTFATLFAEKTKDIASLQRLLGHARLEQTMKYVHVSEKNIDDTLRLFQKGLF